MLSELEVLSPAAVLYDVVCPVPSLAYLWALSHYKHYMSALPWLNVEILQWHSQNRVVGRAQVGHIYGAAQCTES